MPKYDQLSDQLRKRIIQGDYALRGLPAERQLATEHGVSYMTARRALQDLVDRGVLIRGSNGRVEVNREHSGGSSVPPIALLSPTYSSPGFDRWRQMIAQAVERVHGKLRQVLYTHWDDPVILDSLDGFSGVFLLPSSEQMPELLINRLGQSRRPLVILDDDLSYAGLPSIRQFPPGFAQRLLDHLEAQGFTKIDCLNVQPLHTVIQQRIGQWQVWMAAHDFTGRLINEPVEPYTPPFTRAYEVMRRLLAERRFHAEALYCVTTPAAVGAMRAMHEAGIRPGTDVAVCAVDGEGFAEFQIPSLTALEPASITPHLVTCAKWMMGGGGAWNGPLLLEPLQPRLEIRESTTIFQGKSSSAHNPTGH
jgi:hypothetical protein